VPIRRIAQMSELPPTFWRASSGGSPWQTMLPPSIDQLPDRPATTPGEPSVTIYDNDPPGVHTPTTGAPSVAYAAGLPSKLHAILIVAFTGRKPLALIIWAALGNS
jgi:hypothetical protein